jgi:hypothetical protein
MKNLFKGKKKGLSINILKKRELLELFKLKLA